MAELHKFDVPQAAFLLWAYSTKLALTVATASAHSYARSWVWGISSCHFSIAATATPWAGLFWRDPVVGLADLQHLTYLNFGFQADKYGCELNSLKDLCNALQTRDRPLRRKECPCNDGNPRHIWTFCNTFWQCLCCAFDAHVSMQRYQCVLLWHPEGLVCIITVVLSTMLCTCHYHERLKLVGYADQVCLAWTGALVYCLRSSVLYMQMTQAYTCFQQAMTNRLLHPAVISIIYTWQVD